MYVFHPPILGHAVVSYEDKMNFVGDRGDPGRQGVAAGLIRYGCHVVIQDCQGFVVAVVVGSNVKCGEIQDDHLSSLGWYHLKLLQVVVSAQRSGVMMLSMTGWTPPPPSDDATAFFGKQQRYLMLKRHETIVFFIVHIYRKKGLSDFKDAS